MHLNRQVIQKQNRLRRPYHHAMAWLCCLVLAGCGGGGGGGGGGNEPATYPISIEVSGLLSGNNVQLRLTSGTSQDTKAITTNGNTQEFTLKLPLSATYTVTVSNQPSGQTCSVKHGINDNPEGGQITERSDGQTNQNRVKVTCTNIPYSVRVTVTGLPDDTDDAVSLQLNSFTPLVITENSRDDSEDFTFDDTLITRDTYTVVVSTQPALQRCTVSNGSGTIETSNITNVEVNCVNTHLIGGSISGLVDGNTVTLNLDIENLDTDVQESLTSGIGNFHFTKRVAVGDQYAVTEGSVSFSGTPQRCDRISNGRDTMETSDITNVTIQCTNKIPGVWDQAEEEGASIGTNWTDSDWQ